MWQRLAGKMTDKIELRKRSWTVVSFETPAEKEDIACWLMIQCGSIGAQVEPAGEDSVRVEATFDQEEITPALLQQIQVSLEEYGLGSSLSSLRHRRQEEEDWLSKWKEGFEPFQVGEKFLICPPWSLADLSDSQKGNRLLLVLEPGMAFGTGLHATTRYCLCQLENLKAPQMVLDVGTGSGILAIACKFLFPDATVIGVDPDPVAIRVAQENLELNAMEGKVQLICGSTEAVVGRKFDSLLSNLTCEDIISLLPDYESLLAPNGAVICAGVLLEKVDKLNTALAQRGWRTISTKPEGMWCGLTISR